MIRLGVEPPGKLAPFFEEGILFYEDIPNTGKGFILVERGMVVEAIPDMAPEGLEDQFGKQLPIFLPDLADLAGSL